MQAPQPDSSIVGFHLHVLGQGQRGRYYLDARVGTCKLPNLRIRGAFHLKSKVKKIVVNED